MSDVLVSALILPGWQLERSQRLARRYFAGLTVLAALFYIATWLYAANRLWAAQPSRDWTWFWDAYKVHAGVLALLGSVYVLRSVLMGSIDQALATRRAIEASDATIAPVAPSQPLPFSTDEMSKGAVQFVSLVRPERSYARRQQVIPGIFFLALGAACAGLAALFLAVASDLAVLGPWLSVIVLCFFAMTFICTAMGILMLLRARRSLSPLYLTADEWGLAWDSARVRRRRMHIAWLEARAFFRAVPDSLAGARARSIHVLDAGDAVLAWALPSSATLEERAASERLSRLIVTRTHIRLRSVALDSLDAVTTPEELATERKHLDPAFAPTAAHSAWRILLLNPTCFSLLGMLALTGSLGTLGTLGWILDRLHP